MIEMIGTFVLLGALMTMVVPLLHSVDQQRRAADARQLAVQEAANVMERLSARDWNDLTQETADGVSISTDAKAGLREPSLKVTIVATATEPVAKRISVELRWKNRQGDEVAPVRLTAFVYQNEVPK